MTAPFTADDVAARARARLSLDLPDDVFTRPMQLRWGDHQLSPDGFALAPPPGKPAAVLVPVVARERGATLLLTERQSRMRAHAGQVAFPGGRMDPEDRHPLDTALREAAEEIALPAEKVTPLGYLDPYQTGTGYRVVPVVALVAPPFDLVLCEAEVADVFEAPLAFLMDPANHKRMRMEREGRTREFYAMPWERRNIWGATAGMLRNFYERLYL